MVARAARRAGVAGLSGFPAVLPAAVRRATGLGRGLHRRPSRLEAGHEPGQAGLSRGGAAQIARGGHDDAAPCPRTKERLMRVIDMECSIPKPADGAAAPAPAPSPGAPGTTVAERPAGYGMANYGRIFRSREDGGDARPTTELSAFVEMLERIGVARSVPFGTTNDELSGLRRD